jgi:hypothetical protein
MMRSAAFILLGLCLACTQRKEKALSEVTDFRKEEIICPVEPAYFDISYDQTITVSPDIFPAGINGFGAISIVIDSTAAIRRFEVVAINIKNKDSLVYNYATDKNKPGTDRLLAKLQQFVKTICIEKRDSGMTTAIVMYIIPVRFK